MKNMIKFAVFGALSLVNVMPAHIMVKSAESDEMINHEKNYQKAAHAVLDLAMKNATKWPHLTQNLNDYAYLTLAVPTYSSLAIVTLLGSYKARGWVDLSKASWSQKRKFRDALVQVVIANRLSAENLALARKLQKQTPQPELQAVVESAVQVTTVEPEQEVSHISLKVSLPLMSWLFGQRTHVVTTVVPVTPVNVVPVVPAAPMRVVVV